MNSYLVLFANKQTPCLTEQLLQAHIAFLKKLQTEGHLLICGPFTDNQHALFILLANSVHAAEEIIKSDPFIQANYYQHYAIHEFLAAGEENNWLADAPQTISNLN